MFALAVGEDGLYVGGTFATAGSIGASNVARWDGDSWHPLADGVDGNVRALAVYQGDVHAGGDFVQAGGITVEHIARWDGSSWSGLGGGMGGDSPAVLALTVRGDELIAGGWFTLAGGAAANYVAAWDGSGWAPLGDGLDFWVHCLAAYDGGLIAGGQFTFAGGNPAAYIAKWDGANWLPFGSGMDSWVETLLPVGEDLYAGGLFTRAGGVAALHLARWLGLDETGIADESPARPRLLLGGVRPNPAGGEVRWSWYLAKDRPVRLSIHDAQGRLVRLLLDGPMTAGWHSEVWDGRDGALRRPPSGVYFVWLADGSESRVRRLVLTR